MPERYISFDGDREETCIQDINNIDISILYIYIINFLNIEIEEPLYNNTILENYKKIKHFVTEKLYDIKIFQKKIKTKIKTKTKVANNYMVKYKVKPGKSDTFSFNYLWNNLWSNSNFFTTAFAKIRSAWIYIKNTRSNYFGTFYYTGAMLKFENQNNIDILNTFNNKNKKKVDLIKHDAFPYELHPYVSYAYSPYSYVHDTCSAGTFGFKKKNRRSNEVLTHIKNFFNKFFMYYFELYKIDFLFFRLNGLFKLFKSLKQHMFSPLRKNLSLIRKTSLEIKKLKLEVYIYEVNKDAVPKLLEVLASIPAEVGAKPIEDPLWEATKAIFKTIPKQQRKIPEDKYYEKKKSKILKLKFKILQLIRKYPRFVYLMDSTSYPFNGCKRVRHYKK